MRIAFLFLFFMVLLSALYFYFQSPSNDTYSVNAEGGLQHLESTSSGVLSDQSPEGLKNTNNQMKSKLQQQSNGSEITEPVDTKSDFSIKPVDPVSDPGNQIISE